MKRVNITQKFSDYLVSPCKNLKADRSTALVVNQIGEPCVSNYKSLTKEGRVYSQGKGTR
ncbi:MAG: hypothetical protein HRU49_09950 [Winogradskyella sp.]|uniref:hypothetical protein n=1 Tax=Winogradskyella sp. TaxID=1883156 RepID=UPI0025F51BA9|nr:hypothetical protein [Winogradskyella sp.]NRB84078.1 hypothetical protein [Winogradskyella sp.]